MAQDNGPMMSGLVADVAVKAAKAIEEQKFRKWYAAHAKRLNLTPDPDDPRHHYDYRAAYRAGAGPDPKTNHWPSTYKEKGHENLVVGGFHTQTGKRVPGTRRAGYEELVRLGWDKDAARNLAATPEP